jgi:hypothetical protein
MPKAVPVFNVEEASGGNPALREVLRQLTAQMSTQITKTSTAPKGAPKQASATVTFASPFYVVNITNPESQRAASTQQASQQNTTPEIGANASQSVVYNQVRAANSLFFDAAGNVVVYGGDNGSPQTQFVITDLDTSKGWYFQVRSSFDGQTWNQWKTIGSILNENPLAVTQIPLATGSYVQFYLAGEQKIGIGIENIFDQSVITPVAGATMLETLGIAGPNGFTDAGHHCNGINAGIDVNGVVTMNYVSADESGTASCLLFGWDPKGANFSTQSVTGGTWAIFTLSGGTQIAFGSGKVPGGSAFGVPTGFSTANMMAICTPASSYSTAHPAHGVAQASVSGSTCTITYTDGSGDSWGGDALWFAIAWSPALQANVQTVSGGQYLVLHTPSGDIALGMGTIASGSILSLPSGYSFQVANNVPKAIAFASPASYNETGNDMHGVQLCAVNQNGQAILVYSDGEGNQWDGNVNWFCMAWK